MTARSEIHQPNTAVGAEGPWWSHDERTRFNAIVDRLSARYGLSIWAASGPPLDELIATVLSQHTSDVNTARAFASLRAAFPDWRAVMLAPAHEVADAIRCGGLAETKAPRIQAILRAVENEFGVLNLDPIAQTPMEPARTWLTSLPGVGPKTAACVLLFSLGQPAMPVDTHVFRVGSRLGLFGPQVTPATAHAGLEQRIGPDRDAVYAIHLNLIAHGRTICRARNPLCGECVIADLCPSSHLGTTKRRPAAARTPG